MLWPTVEGSLHFIYSPRNMGKKYRGIRMSRIGKCGFILLRPRTVQRMSCGWHLTECISMLSYYTGSFQDFQCVLYALWLHFCKIGCLQTSFQESTSKFSWYLSVSLFWVMTFKPCYWVLMRSFIIMIILILLLYQYLLRLIPILSPLPSLQLKDYAGTFLFNTQNIFPKASWCALIQQACIR